MSKKDSNDEADHKDIVLEEEEVSIGFKGKSEKKLREELKSANTERREYLEGWQRAKADLINFKRESTGMQEKFTKFASEDLIHDILPVLDSFEMAVTHKEEGAERIHKQLLGILKKSGLEEISPMGEKFDTKFHEAIGGEGEKIVEVVKKGYTLHDKIIRPAQVKLGK